MCHGSPWMTRRRGGAGTPPSSCMQTRRQRPARPVGRRGTSRAIASCQCHGGRADLGPGQACFARRRRPRRGAGGRWRRRWPPRRPAEGNRGTGRTPGVCGWRQSPTETPGPPRTQWATEDALAKDDPEEQERPSAFQLRPLTAKSGLVAHCGHEYPHAEAEARSLTLTEGWPSGADARTASVSTSNSALPRIRGAVHYRQDDALRLLSLRSPEPPLHCKKILNLHETLK